MRIKVGMNLKWLGQDVTVITITHLNESYIAPVCSEDTEVYMLGQTNSTFKVVNIDKFNAGDFVNVEYQSVEMQDKKGSIYYLYPYYNVKKEGEKNGTEGIARESEQASDSAT
jgi:hypothetical protein